MYTLPAHYGSGTFEGNTISKSRPDISADDRIWIIYVHAGVPFIVQVPCMPILAGRAFGLFLGQYQIKSTWYQCWYKPVTIACWLPFCHAITSTKCPRALGSLTRPWNVYLSNSAFLNYFLSNHCCSLATIMSYQRMNEKLSNDVCC